MATTVTPVASAVPPPRHVATNVGPVVGAAPSMAAMPPREIAVDRPFPVCEQIPMYMNMPAFETHSYRQVGTRQDFDFPYHDPAYGVGWRYHCPDNYDAHWNRMSMYKETPL